MTQTDSMGQEKKDEEGIRDSVDTSIQLKDCIKKR